jgi:DNA-binding HxlR family transcriptional regulator
VANRAYGQYCGFARALELVGERWALLIVRDLMSRPKRFVDLQRGLQKIPSNILTARLKELEAAGLVERRVAPRSQGGGTVYALTEDGRALEASVVELSRWGAKHLGDPRPGEVITEDSMTMALRTTFRPEAAGRTRARFEFHFGDIVLHAIVRGGALTVGRGALDDADLVVEAGPAIRAVMAQEISPAEAVKSKLVKLRGNTALFSTFAQLFRI